MHLQGPLQLKFQKNTLKSASRACTSICYLHKVNFNGTLQLVMNQESCKVDHPQLITGPSLEQDRSDSILDDKIKEYLPLDLEDDPQDKTNTSISDKRTSDLSDKEMQRRRKIGLANKGRTPWNKGKNHSQETRDRIKKRTIEALRDPKVRNKMCGYSRAHSNLSRERIGASLRRVWAERLKRKRAQENCYLIWARSIAEAAKEGGLDQQELRWDSYRKLKADLMFQYLEYRLEKEKAKEIKRLRAEEKAKVRAEKLEKLARQRKEKEEMAKSRKIEALVRKKLKDEKRKIALSRGLKLKARLTKFHLRQKQAESSDDEVTIKPQIVDEKWDIEWIKVEKKHKRVPLADQIRALRKKKEEFIGENASSDSP